MVRGILEESEVVSATCYEAGYYTYATGVSAAARMYADRQALRVLRAKFAQNSLSDDGDDLTVIRGWSLLFKNQERGRTTSFRRPVELGTEDLVQIQQLVARQRARNFAYSLNSLDLSLNADEERVVTNLAKLVESSTFTSFAIKTSLKKNT